MTNSKNLNVSDEVLKRSEPNRQRVKYSSRHSLTISSHQNAEIHNDLGISSTLFRSGRLQRVRQSLKEKSKPMVVKPYKPNKSLGLCRKPFADPLSNSDPSRAQSIGSFDLNSIRIGFGVYTVSLALWLSSSEKINQTGLTEINLEILMTVIILLPICYLANKVKTQIIESTKAIRDFAGGFKPDAVVLKMILQKIGRFKSKKLRGGCT